MTSRVEAGAIWNRIAVAKELGQPINPADVEKLTDLLAQDPELLTKIANDNQDGNRQEAK